MASQKRSIDYNLDNSGDEQFEAYVPLKKRREEQLKKLAIVGKGSRSGTPQSGKEDTVVDLDPEELEELEKARKRNERTLLAEAQEVKKRKAEEGEALNKTMRTIEKETDPLCDLQTP